MRIEIYGTRTCPFCHKAKEACKSACKSYADIYVGEDGVTKETIQKRVDGLGLKVEVKTVPQIFVDGEYVGGYTDLVKKYDWARQYNSSTLVKKPV